MVEPPYTINDQATYSVNLPSTLCQFCQNVVNQLDRERQEDEPEFEHHRNFTSLQRSADAGCGLCAQFILGVEEVGIDHTVEDASEPRNSVLEVTKGRYFFPTLYKTLILPVPYTQGDLESGYYDWSQEKPLRVVFEVYMVPPPNPGKAPETSRHTELIETCRRSQRSITTQRDLSPALLTPCQDARSGLLSVYKTTRNASRHALQGHQLAL